MQYQFWHAGALIAVGLLAIHLPDSAPLRWAGSLMMVGIVLFCGSLYLLAVTGTRWLGALTPLGGVAWLLAWGLFVAAAVRAG